MKKIQPLLCLLLAAALTVSCVAGPARAAGASFTDVEAGTWYEEAVAYVSDKGLMNGISTTEFGPALPLNRAMVVTVLYRLAGAPDVAGAQPFDDVPVGSYFDAPVRWAYENGVVNGTSSTTFSPARNTTREEMVTFFYRFAGHLGLDTLPKKSLSAYDDAGEVAPFALDAFRWAVAIGLVSGQSSTTLAPRGTSNRAQYATILQRFELMRQAGSLTAEEGLILDLVVLDGVATDLVSGKTFPELNVSGDYIRGGKVTLPWSFRNWTYQMIVDYNESSSAGVIHSVRFVSNNGKYEECSDVFKLLEVGSVSDRGKVRIPWVRDSWNQGYSLQLPIQIHTHASADYEYLSVGDSFWSFSMDSDNGVLNGRIDGASNTMTMTTYTDEEGITHYVDKIFPASFTLNADHAVRQIKLYERPLSPQEQSDAYARSGITAADSGISAVTDGIEELGSSYYLTRSPGEPVTMLHTETTLGDHQLTDESGLSVMYSIHSFVQPDNGIDNSRYESVHITNEPETLTVGKQYPLTALPYPFRVLGPDGKADQFDVTWTTSDKSVLAVIDGLLIAKEPGTAQITATLMGTELSDTITVTVTEPVQAEGDVWYVPADYASPDGDRFSDTDYAMTTRAIYAAIDEAAQRGVRHMIFPAQDFYAVPITDSKGYAVRHYLPSNLTIEFPEGSAFHMMDNEVSRGDPTKIEIHYFEFGVPAGDFTGVCENSHLIMDTFYGERYGSTRKESEYLEENRFVNFGRKAVDCSVEIRNAYSPAGYFLVADGTSSTCRSAGVMTYGDFVHGWLDDSGLLRESENWISTEGFITVPDYGTDGYFLSSDGQASHADKYWGGCVARLYDILWFDAQQSLIAVDRFQGRGEYYEIPANAAFFKVSLQQSELPTPAAGETGDSPWMAIHDDGAAKFCEIKNTRAHNSATGLFSVVGQTDGLWIHDCHIYKDGARYKCERVGDFENGWTATRHSVVSNCFFKGYFANAGSFNSFLHTNYIENYYSVSGEAELLRYINNTTDYVEISEKSQAHIYGNTLYTIAIDRFGTSIGSIHSANNITGKWVRSY